MDKGSAIFNFMRSIEGNPHLTPFAKGQQLSLWLDDGVYSLGVCRRNQPMYTWMYCKIVGESGPYAIVAPVPDFGETEEAAELEWRRYVEEIFEGLSVTKQQKIVALMTQY